MVDSRKKIIIDTERGIKEEGKIKVDSTEGVGSTFTVTLTEIMVNPPIKVTEQNETEIL